MIKTKINIGKFCSNEWAFLENNMISEATRIFYDENLRYGQISAWHNKTNYILSVQAMQPEIIGFKYFYLRKNNNSNIINCNTILECMELIDNYIEKYNTLQLFT